MDKLGRLHTLALSSCMVAIIAVAPLAIVAQTPTPTLTPAQQAAKAKADAIAKARADAIAKQQADAKLRADAIAKAHADAIARAKGTAATTATTAATPVAATTATPAAGTAVQPNGAQQRHQMWETVKANNAATAVAAQPATAATAVTTTATPATAAPAQGSFLSRFMNNSGSPGSSATPQGNSFSSSAPSTTSVGRSAGNNTFAAGLGRFQSGGQSAVLYGCMRSGTRVFCDYDRFSSNVGQSNANWGATLTVPGGRTFSQKTATFVDPDGNSFPTAELNPDTGVRMMVEYDDVPESITSASMVLGSNRIQNVPITPLNVQANGNLAPRSSGYNQQPGNTSATVQQTGTGNGAGLVGSASQAQTSATNTMQNGSDKLNAGTQKVNDTKQKMGSIWSQIKNAGTTKPQ